MSRSRETLGGDGSAVEAPGMSAEEDGWDVAPNWKGARGWMGFRGNDWKRKLGGTSGDADLEPSLSVMTEDKICGGRKQPLLSAKEFTLLHLTN